MTEKRKRSYHKDSGTKDYWTDERLRSQKATEVLARLLRRDPQVNTTPGTDSPARITPRGEVRQFSRFH